MSAHRLSVPIAHRLRPTAAALTRLLSRAVGMAALARSRHSLRHLDEHLLRDIGISRAEALAEASRPGWDAPAHWKD